MPVKRHPENFYYEPVRRFLKTRMGCVVETFDQDGSPRIFIGKGLGGLIVDVYGIRGEKETGSRALEGLAVEVKRSTSRVSLRHIAQAAQYSRLAHRCYLAQPRKFTQKNKVEASRIGVGLLQISRNGSSVKLVAESRRFSPDAETFYMFLHKSLRVVRCGLCSCYQFRYRRRESGVAIKGHWVRDDLSPRKRRGKAGKFNKKMYLCEKCEEIIEEVAATQKLQQAVEALKSRVEKLQEKLRRS